MIVSVSRRTDIPAFYGEWFINRLRAGEVLVRNPLNRKQVSSIPLSRDNVDAFVFWTKDPGPFLQYLPEIEERGFPFYFTITINPYDQSIEGSVPRKKDILKSVEELAHRIGPKRIIWRYDPVIFTEELNRAYHLKWFDYLAGRLQGMTEKCVFSFLADYDKISEFVREKGVRRKETGERKIFVGEMAVIAEKRSLVLASCALPEDYGDLGVVANRCVDPELVESLCGYPIKAVKDKSQRKACGCVESRDIGTYNTCLHSCLYCYANRDLVSMKKKAASYDPKSPLLCDVLQGDEKVTSRRNLQNELF